MAFHGSSKFSDKSRDPCQLDLFCHGVNTGNLVPMVSLLCLPWSLELKDPGCGWSRYHPESGWKTKSAEWEGWQSILFGRCDKLCGWDANSLSARMLHLLHQFVPDLYSVTLFPPASLKTAYSLSGIGRFNKILLCPHEDGQEQRLSSASIKFLWLRQIHNPAGISPALDNALSTLLDPELLFTTLFSCPRSRFLYTSSSGGHAQ